MAIQKNISTSPRKLRLVADMVRKMTPAQAVMTLQFTNKAAAPLLAKVIKTVLANGGNAEGLVFKLIEVNEGLKMRRNRVGTAGRGRSRPYKKRMAHIKIVVTDEVQTKEVKGAKAKVKNMDEIKNQVQEVVTESIMEQTEEKPVVKKVAKKGDN